MSKRYVIQVLETVQTDEGIHAEWQTVQHPAGGDWKTRSCTTAITDAAKLIHAGETRKLQICVSKPVYELSTEVDFETILAAKAVISHADADDFEDEVDEDEEEDAEYDGEDDDDTDDGSESDSPIAFELVDENTHEATDDGSCCFKHRQAWIASQM